MISSVCEKCGTIMEFKIKGSTQGWFCQNCGWNLVTTFISPVETDNVDYSVYLTQRINFCRENVKLIAEINNINFVASRKLLQEQQPVIFRGNAKNVLEVAKMLKEREIEYCITPLFPYESK